MSLEQKLKDFLGAIEGPERCGIITITGDIIELKNISPNPDSEFAMESGPLEDTHTCATWHTHPTSGPNLSVADYRAFVAYPVLAHYVVSPSEIWCFEMAGDILVRRKNTLKARQENDFDYPARPPEGALPAADPG